MRPISSLLLVFAPLALSQTPYIDSIPGYSKLPSCAEEPLSTIVRDMVDGCGDGGELTSYSCFCTQSSSRIAMTISAQVMSNCPDSSSAAATSALDVFESYCQLGDSPRQTKATPTPSNTDHGNGSNASKTALGPMETEDAASPLMSSPVNLGLILTLAIFHFLNLSV